MNPQPDLAKVRAAVEAIEARRRLRVPDFRTYPPKASPTARDAALRKPLTSHGFICRRGFDHPDFLNTDS